MKNWKRLLCVAMTLVMLLGVLPTAAFAEGLTPSECLRLVLPDGENYTYTGSAIEPLVRVQIVNIEHGSYIGELLRPEYDVSYSNNINIATKDSSNPPTVTVTPKATYPTNPLTITFNINPFTVAVSEDDFTLTECAYTGSAVKPYVYLGGNKLTEGTDYTISCNAINAGNATATVTFRGTYSGGPYTKIFQIKPKDISGATMGGLRPAYKPGEQPEPVLNLDGYGQLQKGTDYDLTYPETNTTLTIRAAGKNNYTGTVTATVPVLNDNTPPDIAGVANGTIYYEEKTITVMDLNLYKVSISRGTALVADLAPGADGKVTYTLTPSATPYTIVAQDKVGNTTSITVTISKKPVASSMITVADADNIVFDGTAKTPAITVQDGSATIADSQYTLSWQNNTNAGTATVKVTMKDGAPYQGEATKTFTIKPKTLTAPTVEIPEQTYTGSALTPTITVKDGDKKLAETDYTATFTNNTNAAAYNADKAPTVSVTFRGNYIGDSVTKTFTIHPAPTDKLTLEVAASSAYTGTAPAVTVKNNGTELTEGFTLTYKIKNGEALTQPPVTPGSYTGIAVFNDNYRKTDGENFQLTKDFTITPADIGQGENKAVIATPYDYCHASDSVTVTVTFGDKTLSGTNNQDYSVSYTDDSTTGKRTITVTGQNNYTGTVTKELTLLTETGAPAFGDKALESNKTYNQKTTFQVTGANLLKVIVTNDSTDTEYTAERAGTGIELNFAAKPYTIRAVDKAGKSYTLATNVTVTGTPITDSMVTITGLNDVTYDGTAKVATKIEVKDGDKTLLEGADKDYTVSYTNNTNAGTATVTITGTGNYTGTVSKTFTIKPKALTSTALSGIADKTYTGSPIEQEGLTVKDGEKTLEKGSTKDYTVSYSNNTNPGTAKVTVTMRGNYTGTLEKTFTIGKDLSAMVDKIKDLAGDPDLSYDEKQQIKQLKAAYDALSATDKATVDSGVGSTLMTSFKDKASAAKFQLLNEPSLGYYRYTKGTSSNVVIKIDANLGPTTVEGIEIGANKTPLNYPDDYSVESGSIVITLKSTFLKTLKTSGKYNVYVTLNHGDTGYTEVVETKVYVRSAIDIPQTGDPFKMTLWVGLLGASVLALAGLGVYEVVKKKKKSQKRLEAAVDLGDEPSDTKK